jgi:hypothetical protein
MSLDSSEAVSAAVSEDDWKAARYLIRHPATGYVLVCKSKSPSSFYLTHTPADKIHSSQEWLISFRRGTICNTSSGSANLLAASWSVASSWFELEGVQEHWDPAVYGAYDAASQWDITWSGQIRHRASGLHLAVVPLGGGDGSAAAVHGSSPTTLEAKLEKPSGPGDMGQQWQLMPIFGSPSQP